MNKLIVSYLLVTVYIVALFRPLMPIVDYYIHYDYIAEKLCENRNKPILACNGKCYLAKEIQKTLPESPIENNSKIPKIDVEKFPVTQLEQFDYKLVSGTSKNLEVQAHISHYTQEYLFSLLRPPQV